MRLPITITTLLQFKAAFYSVCLVYLMTPIQNERWGIPHVMLVGRN